MNGVGSAIRPSSAVTGPTEPPPLTAWDADGSPTVLSYQMPVAYRITGRNYLVLDYDDDDFIPISDGTSADPAPARIAPAGEVTGGDEQGAGPADGVDTTPAVSGTTATLRDAIVAPSSVVIGSPDAAAPADGSPIPVIVLHPYQLSDELSALTWDQVAAARDDGRQLAIYRSASGQWDYRIVTPSPAPTAVPDGLAGAGSSRARLRALSVEPVGGHEPLVAAPAATRVDSPRGTDPGDREVTPYTTVLITSPNRQHPHQDGPSTGVTLTVQGTCGGRAVWNKVVYVSVNGGAEVRLDVGSGSAWSTSVQVTTSGTYTLSARAVADSGEGPQTAGPDSFAIMVDLALPPAPPAAPLVLITTPDPRHDIIDPTGRSIVKVAGTVSPNGGSAVSQVMLTVDGDDRSALTVVVQGDLSWSTTVLLMTGRHDLLATATNADGVPAPPAVSTITISQRQRIQRISRSLLVGETMALSSYLTSVGAGRLVKVFSLLAGEEATFTVDTYSKESTTLKNASSILDSSSTEASSDFEDTLNDEQSSKRTSTSELDLGLEARVAAHWGWGDASIKGTLNSKANSSREDTAKAVRTAVAKHATKAATNRSVTVNAEFTNTVEQGKAENSTRTLRNINVGRVLNYTFRQVTQEILVTLSLVDVCLVDRTVDILLNDDGTQQRDEANNLVTVTSVTEIGLSELKDFAAANLREDLRDAFVANLQRVMSTVPDHGGELQSVVETFVPTVSGQSRPDLAYLRVPPGLAQDVKTPGGFTVTVPGIVLSTDVHAMPVDALVVDAVLGGGSALDEYSKSLQEVTIGEREAAVAREQLAQQIVATKDADAAALWKEVFPTPSNPVVTIPTAPAVTS